MDTRQQLLDSALGLFAARGYDAVGVQQVVETAGVTKPSLYHHFGSKLGLLEALIDEGGAPLVRALGEACVYEGDLDQTLERVLDAYLGFAEASPAYYRFWLSLLFSPPEHEARARALALFGTQRRLLEAMFRDAARDHGNMAGRHLRYAYVFVGLVNSVVTANISGEPIEPAQRREILHQFSHGIYS